MIPGPSRSASGNQRAQRVLTPTWSRRHGRSASTWSRSLALQFQDRLRYGRKPQRPGGETMQKTRPRSASTATGPLCRLSCER